jgi:cardiolipin synthase
VFEQDLARSRRISLQEWQDRPLREKLRERLALLLDSQL